MEPNETPTLPADDEKIVWVNIGELAVSRDPAEALAAHGVGSCVICCAFDHVARVAGMVHIMLPALTENHRRGGDSGYADVGIPKLIGAMREHGARDNRMVVKLAGGACIVKTDGVADRDIGRRNLLKAREILKEMGLKVVFEDVGGVHWRNVHFHASDGRFIVSDRRKSEKVCEINSIGEFRKRKKAAQAKDQ